MSDAYTRVLVVVGPVCHHDTEPLSPCCGAPVVYDGFCAKCREACGPGECRECDAEAAP